MIDDSSPEPGTKRLDAETIEDLDAEAEDLARLMEGDEPAEREDLKAPSPGKTGPAAAITPTAAGGPKA